MNVPLIIFAGYIWVMIDTAVNYAADHQNKESIVIFNMFALLAEIFQMVTIGHEYFF